MSLNLIRSIITVGAKRLTDLLDVNITDMSAAEGKWFKIESGKMVTVPGIPPNGNENQVLGKLSSTSYDVGWVTVSGTTNSGTTNSGTNPPTTTSLEFNGTNTDINLGTNVLFAPSTGLTIEATLTLYTNAVYHVPVYFGNAGGGSILYAFQVNPSTSLSVLNGYPDTGGYHCIVESFDFSCGLTSGPERHIVFTWDGTSNTDNCCLYIDGTLFGNATKTTPSISSLDPWAGEGDSIPTLHIGSLGGPTYYNDVNGIVKKVRLYDRALTSNEVIDHYNGGLGIDGDPNETGLLGGWRLNEGTNTTAHDYSTYANDATIQNGTWV